MYNSFLKLLAASREHSYILFSTTLIIFAVPVQTNSVVLHPMEALCTRWGSTCFLLPQPSQITWKNCFVPFRLYSCLLILHRVLPLTCVWPSFLIVIQSLDPVVRTTVKSVIYLAVANSTSMKSAHLLCSWLNCGLFLIWIIQKDNFWILVLSSTFVVVVVVVSPSLLSFVNLKRTFCILSSK